DSYYGPGNVSPRREIGGAAGKDGAAETLGRINGRVLPRDHQAGDIAIGRGIDRSSDDAGVTQVNVSFVTWAVRWIVGIGSGSSYERDCWPGAEISIEGFLKNAAAAGEDVALGSLDINVTGKRRTARDLRSVYEGGRQDAAAKNELGCRNGAARGRIDVVNRDADEFGSATAGVDTALERLDTDITAIVSRDAGAIDVNITRSGNVDITSSRGVKAKSDSAADVEEFLRTQV